MSIKSEQRVYHSIEEKTQSPTVDGQQSVLDVGYRHVCEYFATFVSEGELQSVLDGAIPAPYVLVGEPSVQMIDVIHHYTVTARGEFVSNDRAAPRFEAANSGRFY